MKGIKAITLHQPWATLVAIGAKKIETRSWNTHYRGPLAIHASKTFSQEHQHLCFREPFRSILIGQYSFMAAGEIYFGKHSFPLGAVIATCELIGVDQFGEWINEHEPMVWNRGRCYFELTPQERAFGDYSIGRYGWFLGNIERLPEPIPAKGALGLWNWMAIPSAPEGGE